MKINSLNYPYPVLSNYNDDYIDSEFDVEFELKNKGFINRSLDIKFNLKNKELEKLVNDGDANFAVHVECPLISFRKLYNLKSNTDFISIPISPKKMRDKIEVNFFLLLNKDLKVYSNKKFNREIYGENYSVKNLNSGSILATVYTEIISIETKGDDFEKISSIIKVAESNNTYMEVDMDNSSFILIKLPKTIYKQYVNLSKTVYEDIILSSVIYPALVYILDEISEKNFMYIELDWYQIILKKLNSADINISDINNSFSSLRLAQMILESPLERGLQSLEDEVERGN